MGCLFNVSGDPTEHIDLLEGEPTEWAKATAANLLQRLKNYSATAFDPSRGMMDQRACARMKGPNKGFFGPWLELD